MDLDCASTEKVQVGTNIILMQFTGDALNPMHHFTEMFDVGERMARNEMRMVVVKP